MNRMHFPWVVVGRSPSALRLVAQAIKARIVPPEEVCIFTQDIDREFYNDDMKVAPPFRSPHPLVELRPATVLTRIDYKEHTALFFDRS